MLCPTIWVNSLIYPGTGKRRGTANVCLSLKLLWISRICVLCRLLKKMSHQKKIYKHIYHSIYVLAKGNQFKNKLFLLKSTNNLKAVRARERYLKDQS